MGSIISITHDPKHFYQPEIFNPDRFIQNGKFMRNPRVCVFSTGLRSCIGKKLAQQEVFSYAAHVVHHFKLEHIEGKLDKYNFEKTFGLENDFGQSFYFFVRLFTVRKFQK